MERDGRETRIAVQEAYLQLQGEARKTLAESGHPAGGPAPPTPPRFLPPPPLWPPLFFHALKAPSTKPVPQKITPPPPHGTHAQDNRTEQRRGGGKGGHRGALAPYKKQEQIYPN